jgi:AAA domain
MRIATGMEVHGVPCQKGAVLHVAGEDELGLRQRLEAFCRRHGLKDPSYGILPGRLDLVDESSVDALIADVQAAKADRGEPVVLVIVDTLARCARIEENSSSDMGEVVAACDRIRAEAGAAVLLIHHPGKEAKKGARGSSALRAAVDSEIEVQIKSGDRGVWVTKQRNGRAQFGWPFKLEEIEVWRDPESDRAESACTVEHGAKTDGKVLGRKLNWGSKKKLGPNQQRLRDALEAQYRVGIDSWDRADLRQLARATIRARSSIQSAMDGLIAQGVLAESVDGRLLLLKPPERAAVPASIKQISAEGNSNVNPKPQLPNPGPVEPDLGGGEQPDCFSAHINVERIEMRRPYEV